MRDTGGHAVAMAWTMANLYDVGPGETMFTASDVGWVVGHSYIVYAPLIVGATTIIYEGKPVGTPDAGQFWRVIAEHGAKSDVHRPHGLPGDQEGGPEGRAAGPSTTCRTCVTCSSRASAWTPRPTIGPRTCSDPGHRPLVADGDGVGDLREPAGLELLPIKPGSPTKPMPGWDVRILDAQVDRCRPARTARSSSSCRCRPARCRPCGTTTIVTCGRTCPAFDGYYLTGDGGHIDEDGYLYVMGRTDDVINVAGHRLSTGGMEEALASHPAVAECAVIGVADTFKGQVPRGFVVLKAGVDRPEEELRAELVALVRERIGAVASLREVAVVPGLPKTRSGKILRKTMRGIADGLDEPVPSTIDDVGVLDALRPVLRKE